MKLFLCIKRILTTLYLKMENDKVKQVIDMISQLDDNDVGYILMDISKRVWIPQWLSKEYLETLLNERKMTENKFELICNDLQLNEKIIEFIEDETQIKYLNYSNDSSESDVSDE